MTGARLDIQWSPVHPDKFITWGTEIYLYETLPKKNAPKSSCVAISETTVAHQLATAANHHYVKCIDIYCQPEPDLLLAVGQANGKVVLTTFGPSVYDAAGLSGLELAPKHARQCNTVAWNPSHPSLIAAGLDKYRTDHSVLLWDVLKCSPRPSESTVRPVAELGLSDTAHSLAWLPQQPRSLVIGMNNKHLKLVDLRDPSKASNSAPTKAVYGVAVAPHSDHQLASFFENQIAIWDLRSFEKPVLTLPQAKTVTKIIWCPTRHNLLGSLQRDSTAINLHDVQQSMDETEPSVLERSVQPQPTGAEELLTAFDWHPTHDNRLLTTALSGALIDYTVFERMTVNWSHNSHVVWTFGRRTLKMISDKDSIYNSFEDISTKIKRRAITGYGLKDEIWQNGELAEDVELKNLWHWLYCSRNLAHDRHLLNNGLSPSRYPGVRSVLGMDSNSSIATKSDVASLPLAETCQSLIRVYRSEDRDKALQLCGWLFDRDMTALSTFLESLEADGEVCRAAAIAVFSLRLRHAVQILTRADPAHSDNLNVIAMALSGYTDAKNSMWREQCLASCGQLSNPYLRAIFAFLTADNDTFDGVLNETGMAVEDRVAFACTFLSNSRLYDFLDQLTGRLVAEGCLAGMLLTGAGAECVPLLQNYLNQTGDVQSVALVAICVFPSQLLDTDHHVQDWINSYRNLLNSWRMWNHRARVDIYLNTRNPGTKPPQQVYVLCNFCGKSVSAYLQTGSLGRGQLARLGATSNKLKMSCCPHCRKPQPRCAICLVNMGTPSCYEGPNPPSRSPPSSLRLSEFSSWYTWCQTCRHGGHASHMTQWFREHTECPVTACTCRCLSLDTSSKISSLTSAA